MKNKYMKWITALSLILLFTSCAGVVRRPAADNIKTVAIVSIVSNETLMFKNSKKEIKPATKKPEIMSFVRNLVDESPEIITNEFNNVNGWTIKNTDSFINSKEYQDFASSVKETWKKYLSGPGNNIITPYNNKMPFVPPIALFADDEEKATNEQYKKICKLLEVDAIALIYIDYSLEYKGSKIIPEVSLGTMVVNKNAENAVLAFGSPYSKKSNNTYQTRMEGDFEFIGRTPEFARFTKGQNPKGEYINLLEFLLAKTVSKINAGLQQ
ncbi:MAG: hypothetical protein OEZ22_09395 [Spirochaetia bacterium]|nr:hypothetical protein [Spirochaetia bacterium]